MAEGKKPNRGQFKKGQSGNPLGAQLHNPEVIAVRRLTKAEIAEMGTMLLDLKMSEFKALAKDDTAPALKVMLAGMVVAATKGNPSAFEKLLDRIVGKTKDRIEVSGAVTVKQRYAVLSDEELKKKYEEKLARVKKLVGGTSGPGGNSKGPGGA